MYEAELLFDLLRFHACLKRFERCIKVVVHRNEFTAILLWPPSGLSVVFGISACFPHDIIPFWNKKARLRSRIEQLYSIPEYATSTAPVTRTDAPLLEDCATFHQIPSLRNRPESALNTRPTAFRNVFFVIDASYPCVYGPQFPSASASTPACQYHR